MCHLATLFIVYGICFHDERAGGASLPPTPSLIQLQNMCVLRTTQAHREWGGAGWPSQPLKGQCHKFFLTFLFFCPRPELENKNYKIKLRTIPVKKIKNAPPGNPVFSIPKQSSWWKDWQNLLPHNTKFQHIRLKFTGSVGRGGAGIFT